MSGQTPAGTSASDPEPGISETLARDRAARVSNVRYELSFVIPSDHRAAISGRTAIAFTLSEASAPLAIDFAPNQQGRVRRVEVSGAAIDARQVNGHIVVPAACAPPGRQPPGDRLRRGRRAAQPQRRFPLHDFRPGARARSVPVLRPAGSQGALDAVARRAGRMGNASPTAPKPHARSRDGRTRLTFAETQPISTYLFAFAAGQILGRARRAQTAARCGCSTAKPTPRRSRATATRSSTCTRPRSTGCERYTGIPYPFGKFDFLLVPAFQFGGMEHPGAIFYNATGLMLDESATQNQQLERASVISHETAHMWFGDLVTMRWFNDVWMKEVFANFMAAKIVNPSFPADQPRPAIPARATTRRPTTSTARRARTRSASRSRT